MYTPNVTKKLKIDKNVKYSISLLSYDYCNNKGKQELFLHFCGEADLIDLLFWLDKIFWSSLFYCSNFILFCDSYNTNYVEYSFKAHNMLYAEDMIMSPEKCMCFR